MRLFIAEKPSLAREIAKGLGADQKANGCLKNLRGDVVTWCFGHILRQYNPDEYSPDLKEWRMDSLPIIPKAWKLKVSDDCKKQFIVIRDLIAQADTIVNAGDPDREGQLLIDEVLAFVKNTKPVQRILLNALDEKSVQAALKDLRDNQEFVGLRDAALGRSRADWLIGMNLSRAYTLAARAAGYNQALRIGRVKTPTMSLVVRREKEIQDFQPVTHYQLQVTWLHPNGKIKTLWQPGDNQPLDQENRLLDKTIAEETLHQIQNHGTGAIASIKTQKKEEAQRLPYSLSALQIDAGKKFGYDPQTVLNTMQELYEKKFTTYPRSDCDYLPENQFADAATILQNLKGIPALTEAGTAANSSIRSRAWNDKKISAHHAIIPTTVLCPLSALTKTQQDLYVLVARAYLAQFYPTYIYNATKLVIEDCNEQFTANGRMVLQIGWRSLYSQQEKNEDEITLPENLSEGEIVQLDQGEVLNKVTTPPKRFTPATLLKAMKEIHKYVKDPALKAELKSVQGIGTEATRAAIIDELIKPDKNGRSFLNLEKKYLLPTETAIMMVRVLPASLTYPDMTAIWEDLLEEICNRQQSLTRFSTEQETRVQQLVDEAKQIHLPPPAGGAQTGYAQRESLGKCPRCGKNIYENQKSFFCEGYKDTPKCSFSVWKDNKFFTSKGVKLTARMMKSFLAGKAIKMKGLKKKDGSGIYTAIIQMQDDGSKWVNFVMAFE